MSDTPISDSTPHNVADLGMLCRRLERELNAANYEVQHLREAYIQLQEGNERQRQRIKRLEEAGDGMRIWITVIRGYLPECTNIWRKAKEDKL